MQYTTNFNLKKPEGTDLYDIGNENDNMDTLDEALAKAHSTDDGASNTINDSDYVPLATSANAKKKSTWSNVKNVLKKSFASGDMIAPIESDATADRDYAIGEQFVYNGLLYKATDAITEGDTITPETNCDLSDDVTSQISYLGNRVGNVEIITEPSGQEMSYADIHNLVSAGRAKEFFGIDSQIVVPYTATDGTVYEMPFDVVHFEDVELMDGTTTPGMWLMSHYASLEGVQFDAPEPDNTLGSGGTKDDNVAIRGYNRWSESGIRAWLNSNESAGNWWGNTFERNGTQVTRRSADVAPEQLNTYNGFLEGLPSDFISILGQIKVQTACNTVTDSGVTDITYDKIFLPSLEQMYGNPQIADIEGSYWEYWKQRLGLTSPASYHPTLYQNYLTYALENHFSAVTVRLRSAKRDNSYNAWRVYSTGYLNNSGIASVANRCIPCCVII